MGMGLKHGIALAMLVSLFACARHEPQAADAGGVVYNAMPRAALAAPPGTFLAYEDSVEIALPREQIVVRVHAMQKACVDQRFGDCSVLEVSQRGGENARASLTVRIAPKGVEPFITLAGEGAEVGSRDTRAEDLAEAVAENQKTQDRLTRERARLEEFQRRPDLKVADMIALSQRLAELDGELQGTQQQQAQHRRRIDTHKVTLEFVPPNTLSDSSEVRAALSDFGDTLSAGTAMVIRVIAALLPALVLLGLPAFLLVRRWMRRRKTRI